MAKDNKIGRLVKRFVLAFAETHASVIGDIAGVAVAFQGESFVSDLVVYQVVRKLSGVGIRDTLFTFLMQDQGFKSLLGI